MCLDFQAEAYIIWVTMSSNTSITIIFVVIFVTCLGGAWLEKRHTDPMADRIKAISEMNITSDKKVELIRLLATTGSNQVQSVK